MTAVRMFAASSEPKRPTTVTVQKRRGRGQRHPVELVGEPVRDPHSDQVVGVTVEPLRGADPKPLLELIKRRGLDLTVVLGEGFNAEQLKLAREAYPSFEQRVLSAGLGTTKQDARITALHIRKLAKRLNQPAERLLDAIRRAVEEGDGRE